MKNDEFQNTVTSEDQQPVFCNDVALGESFRELGVDVIQGETMDFVSRWFRSSANDADLMIWMDAQKRVIKQQISFFGQVVEWNAIHGTRTGLIVEEELVHGDGSCEVAETVRFDVKPQADSVRQAGRVLAAVGALNPAERADLIFNFRESPKLHKNARERALKTWSLQGEDIVMESRPSFFKRVRGWFLGT